MLQVEFWKSKQGIRFFDIQRLVFFDPPWTVVRMQKYPTKAKDYLGHMVSFYQKTFRKANFYEKIQSSTKLYCVSRSTYIFIYGTFCQPVNISFEVWIDFCGYIWICNFHCHNLLFYFFPKEIKRFPHLFQNTVPIAVYCHLLGKIYLKNVVPKFLKSMSQMSGWWL